MTTLTDLKRLLDEGEALVNGTRTISKNIERNYYYLNAFGPNSEGEMLVFMGDPSLWHQRDQIGAEKPVTEPPLKGPDVLMEQVMEAYSAPYKPEKPVMVAVPIEQWDALQEELTELRRFKESMYAG